ncbi:unnamed protein product [Periconia digitata]|uniref:Uncharacterized protein n=1 Tax=Periconia digitata TaxID=1303443 RepID=A0A9W4UN23_9PLEO|nr:unnamed protein product [Periconia digitata]
MIVSEKWPFFNLLSLAAKSFSLHPRAEVLEDAWEARIQSGDGVVSDCGLAQGEVVRIITHLQLASVVPCVSAKIHGRRGARESRSVCPLRPTSSCSVNMAFRIERFNSVQ